MHVNKLVDSSSLVTLVRFNGQCNLSAISELMNDSSLLRVRSVLSSAFVIISLAITANGLLYSIYAAGILYLCTCIHTITMKKLL